MANDYDYLFKVCILGDAAVGKSSMISQYVDRTFAEDQKSTIGIDYRVKSATVDGKVVKLQIWDTAGQERFRPFRTNHLRAADGIIVVYSITDKKSFDAIPGWLAEVKDEGGRRPRVLLIGNKLDREEEREVSLETVKAFADANCLEHLETSAKTDANIVETFEKLAHEMVERAAKAPDSFWSQPDVIRLDAMNTSEIESSYWDMLNPAAYCSYL